MCVLPLPEESEYSFFRFMQSNGTESVNFAEESIGHSNGLANNRKKRSQDNEVWFLDREVEDAVVNVELHAIVSHVPITIHYDNSNNTNNNSSSANSSLSPSASTDDHQLSGGHNPSLGEYPRNLNEVMHFTAKALVREALDRRSLDNVTVMVVQL